MRGQARIVLILGVVQFGTAWMASAAEPTFVNARVTRHSASGGLSPAFEALRAAATEPSWIGYSVPGTAQGQGCCDSCLEGGGPRDGCRSDKGDATVPLEMPREMAILFRVDGTIVRRVKSIPFLCTLDAAGRRVEWLTDVRPTESTALLAALVKGSDGGDLFESALVALAVHADPSADVHLDAFAAQGQGLHLRKQAAFWMGAARERHGYLTLARLAREDEAPELREHVVFALTLSREPGATEAIIEVARRDASPHVRGQALFWLGQKASRRAGDVLVGAAENDPEAEVKEKAIFALSQLPKDEGVPLLVRQARTNRDPRVRQRALFWLGQSGDPRALALFEEILAP